MVVACVLLSLALVPAAAGADEGTRYTTIDAGVGDVLWVTLGVAAGLTLEANEVRAHSRRGRGPGFDYRVRQGLAVERTSRPRRISDALLWSLELSALSGPSIGNRAFDHDTRMATMLAAESLFTTLTVVGITKHIVRRRRPCSEACAEHQGYASFASGHSAMSFAAATTLAINARSFQWGPRSTRWIAPSVAFGAAAATAFLRIRGDRHWLSDVLAGALIGTATTLATHALRAPAR